jgi:hypothetical protein
MVGVKTDALLDASQSAVSVPIIKGQGIGSSYPTNAW